MSDSSSVTRILCVDDEPQLLSSLRRVFRGSDYEVDTAGDGFEGLQKIKTQPYDVIISDMRMPHMDGAEFLTAAAQLMPDCPRILLTGFSDHESTVRAINDGKIFSFISKPWDNEQLRETVRKALESRSHNVAKNPEEIVRLQSLEQEKTRLQVETQSLLNEVDLTQHQLEETTAFLDLAQEELRESYSTCMKVFANVVNMRLGNSTQISETITQHAVAVSSIFRRPPGEIATIRNAAMLHQLGKMGLPDSILRKPLQSLSPDERDIYATYPVKGEQILLPIEVLHDSGRMIRHQNENFDGSGMPDGLVGAAIPLGSRILRVVIDYLSCINGTKTGVPLSGEIARSYIVAQQEVKYDPSVVTAYFSFLASNLVNIDAIEEMVLEVKNLLPGMRVTRDVHNKDGMLLIAKNTRLTRNLINHLRNFELRSQLQLHVPIMPEIHS